MHNPEKKFSEQLGKTMKGMRKRRKLTQIDVARTLGLTQGAICKFENGKSIPSLFQWLVFCGIAGSDFDCFFGTDYKWLKCNPEN
jgi:transcriptional regulator with XRE-family HTH domain